MACDRDHVNHFLSTVLLPMAFPTCVVALLVPFCSSENSFVARIVNTGQVRRFLVNMAPSSSKVQPSILVRTSTHALNCAVVLAPHEPFINNTEVLQDRLQELFRASILFPQSDTLMLVGKHSSNSDNDKFHNSVNRLMKNVVILSGGPIKIEMSQLCPHCPSGAVKVELQSCNQEGDACPQRIFPDVYRNFYGKRLHIAFFVSALNSQSREVNETAQVFKTGGYNLRSAITLCETLNATWAIRPHKRFSFKKVNGSFVAGIFKDFQDGRAEIGTMGAMLYPFYSVADLSSPIDSNYFTFFTAPAAPLHSWADLTRPLGWQVWLGICFALNLSLTALNLLRLLALSCESKHLLWWQWETELTYLGSSLLLQSSAIPRRATVYRAFAPLWYFFVIVVSTAYSGKLFSSFMFPPLEAVPETFPQLALDSSYRIGFSDLGDSGATIKMYFRNSRVGSPERSIPDRIELFTALDCLNEATKQDGFACIGMGSNIESYMVRICGTAREKACMVKHADATAMYFYHALAFPKGSYIVSATNRVVGPLVAGGMIQKWIKQTNMDLRQEKLELCIRNGRRSLETNQEHNAKPLRLSNLSYTFALYFIGVLLGVSVRIGGTMMASRN